MKDLHIEQVQWSRKATELKKHQKHGRAARWCWVGSSCGLEGRVEMGSESNTKMCRYQVDTDVVIRIEREKPCVYENRPPRTQNLGDRRREASC